MTSAPPPHLVSAVRQVAQSAHKLASLGAETKSHALELMAQAIESNQDQILEANTLDLEASREMAVPDLVLDWLRLTPERLQVATKILRRLSALGVPSPQMSRLPYAHDTATAYYQLQPLGVIALVYEAFPELGAIAAGLCCRVGNGLVLKGGSEASQTNQVIVQVLQEAIAMAGLPATSLLFLSPEQGEALRNQLVQLPDISLVIPYGRPSLIQQIKRQATVPVLAATMGNCYLYWSTSSSSDLVGDMVLDSHRGQPDAVNAIEKVLVHTSHASSMLTRLWNRLRGQGFDLQGDEQMVTEFPELTLATPQDWQQPYLGPKVAFKRVDSLGSAIAWINRYSSGHADCLITESYAEGRQFALTVSSTSVYINASSRFSRNPKQGTGIALGMSSQEGRCGGIIGLEALTTIKQIVQGN
ncbi:MAG: glutamate-5-semialdehyde dehydrogenase [Leptolyngbyaceae cyanobacterium SM1_1_3]|nr:glutamate-5-semialdehyde dehydrogenase [Leptolyngbyaceae cyanobacterium SM1_1_3]NJN04072.1 glutamate-5-semialdehyde dehydrogenase [Leptolyngbyaceae cyanobacterium RM1_1_2]